ncbi:MAG: Gfo/Idh/MocA family oxidoreductase [Phycisphaeraceae bacterium]|nr:Gfo/Idh/MocA family oxidoreductase [Phycisphaeraceae bacterium]
MTHMNRREFAVQAGKITIASMGGIMALSALNTRKALGANDRINMALIGCGGRGRQVMKGLVSHGAQLVCACDVNEHHRRNTAAEFQTLQNRPVKTDIEMRRVFEDKDVDAVLVATPEHWHALATVWACQAGKDVYVEKNPTISIWEGQKMIEAAQKYQRIVQVGFQNRSAPYARSARAYIASGKLGKIVHVKSYNMLGGGHWRARSDTAIPAGLDWDRWLGPAREVPYNANRHSMNGRGGWGSYWDYSGGTLADDASHVLDLARLVLGDPGHPHGVYHSGGNLAFGSKRETPEMQCITYDFPDFTWTCESSTFAPYMSKTSGKIRQGNMFPVWAQNATRTEIYGTQAMMYLGRHGGGWQVVEKEGKVAAFDYGHVPDQEHQPNFLTCIKTRKQPNGHIQEAHHSACLVHLGNLAYRAGNRHLIFNGDSETFVNSDEANALIKPHARDHYRIPDIV